jgi:hypothetical protein
MKLFSTSLILFHIFRLIVYQILLGLVCCILALTHGDFSFFGPCVRPSLSLKLFYPHKDLASQLLVFLAHLLSCLGEELI